eukprot:scaffold18402_cov32-Prasinocladus_malaysianus.AAC.1
MEGELAAAGLGEVAPFRGLRVCAIDMSEASAAFSGRLPSASPGQACLPGVSAATTAVTCLEETLARLRITHLKEK